MSNDGDWSWSGPVIPRWSGPIVPRWSGPVIPRSAGGGGRPQIGRTRERRPVGLGWKRDLADIRDLTLDNKALAGELKKKKKSLIDPAAKLKSHVDNREYCSAIEDQGNIGSCTAQAVVGLMEYMMRRASGRHIDGSRLFVYKSTRNLLGWDGDTGAYLRTAIQSVATFGIPPEEHYPYIPEMYDEEPSAFLYSFAANYQALNYTRLDPFGKSPTQIRDNIRWALHGGYGVVFGFSVFSSLGADADVPFPDAEAGDKLQGGHAVMAVGYDDNHPCKNAPDGAFLIRNSWGTSWGDGGYGYLPYVYIDAGLASDFWTVLKWEWIDTNKFN